MANKDKFLLPSGFRDLLFTEAKAEFVATKNLIENFEKWSYQLVSTPLVEFETSLFEGTGNALHDKTFKMFDPLSQKSMGIRADITPQISRLVESRLIDEELPLRLCYFGNILRTTPANTRADRQLRQIGAELITKTANPEADAEIIILAAESLMNLGLKKLTVDLNTPNLLEKIIGKIDAETQKNINKRDIKKLPKEIATLVAAAGNAEKALQINISNKEAKAQIAYVSKVFELVKNSQLPIQLTADFAENRGFEYHNTISFSLFAGNVRDELGRGGRYKIGKLNGSGFTIYVNSFIDKLEFANKSKNKTVKITDYYKIKQLQADGFTVKCNQE